MLSYFKPILLYGIFLRNSLLFCKRLGFYTGFLPCQPFGTEKQPSAESFMHLSQ